MNLKILFVSGLLIFRAFLIQGQPFTDTIMLTGYFKTNYVYDGKKLGPKQLLNITKSNPEAHRYMKRASQNRVAGIIFGSVGGFLAGWALGDSLGRTIYGRNKLDKKIFYSGLGLIGLSIPFSAGYPPTTLKAVRIYNKEVKESQSYLH